MVISESKHSWGSIIRIKSRVGFTVALHPNDLKSISRIRSGSSWSIKTGSGSTWSVSRNGEELTFRATDGNGDQQITISRSKIIKEDA